VEESHVAFMINVGDVVRSVHARGSTTINPVGRMGYASNQPVQCCRLKLSITAWYGQSVTTDSGAVHHRDQILRRLGQAWPREHFYLARSAWAWAGVLLQSNEEPRSNLSSLRDQLAHMAPQLPWASHCLRDEAKARNRGGPSRPPRFARCMSKGPQRCEQTSPLPRPILGIGRGWDLASRIGRMGSEQPRGPAGSSRGVVGSFLTVQVAEI
jgi:hypothetical protein